MVCALIWGNTTLSSCRVRTLSLVKLRRTSRIHKEVGSCVRFAKATTLHRVLLLLLMVEYLALVRTLTACFLLLSTARHLRLTITAHSVLQQYRSLATFLPSFSLILALRLEALLLLLVCKGLSVLLVKLILINFVERRQRTVLFAALLVRLARLSSKHRIQLLWCCAGAGQLLTTNEGLFLIQLTTAAKRGLL